MNEAHDVEEALDGFGIRQAHLIRSFEESTRNDNLLIEDDGRHLVLRKCVRNESVARIRWQCGFQSVLRDVGFPVPAVLAATTGELLTVVGGVPWILQTFEEGEHYNFSRIEQAEEAGRRLAEFHTRTSGIPAAGSEHLLERRVHTYWSQPAEEMGRMRERLADAGLDETIDHFEEWLTGLLREWPAARLDALPVGWNHTDWHGRNLLFEGDRLAALLDFDMVERSPYALDIADGIIRFAREARGSYVLRPEVARRFLAAYDTIRPLTREERRAIPVAAPFHEAPLVHYLEHHPEDRRDPKGAFVARAQRWHELLALRPVLAQIVAD